MIWMISGLHHPRWLSNILDNYNRQTYPNKRLIIVENGDGIGISVKLPKDIIILRSDSGPAQPMNVGIEWLKQHAEPQDWFCKCDSDDYYGPQYLDQIHTAISSGADYTGRKALYIKTSNDKLWFAESKDESFIFHGPTIAARIESSLYFPLVKTWGEDIAWCKAMHNAGYKSVTLCPEGFCYQRWPKYNHTWPCTDIEIRVLWRVDFEEFEMLDFDIINGIKKRPIGKILHVPEVDSSNFMPFRILKERSLGCVGVGF
jgi:glycosyltransferase involved in cell wall biosynthesis